MPTNLELKARYPSPQRAHERAASCGAEPRGTLIQQDTYYRVPHGRLKLREAAGETPELIYYERQEETSERWCTFLREPVAGAAGIGAILAAAFGILAVVRKRRDLYLFRDARIHIDDVEDLGTFVEFEVTGGRAPATARTMRELREAFGIGDESVVKGSYSDMIAAKRISGGT